MSYCASCGSQLDAVGVCHTCSTVVAARQQFVEPMAKSPRSTPWLVMWGCALLVGAGVLFVVLTRHPASEATSVTTVTEPTSIPQVTSVAEPVVGQAQTEALVTAPVTTTGFVPALPTVPPTTIPSTGWDGAYIDAPGSGVLHIGHQGRRVQELQVALGNAGVLAPPYDGDFGLGTEAGVLEFQRQQGLTADGLAGSRTLAALGVAIGFETYEDATTATVRFLNTGDGTGLSQQMTDDLRAYVGAGEGAGATWSLNGPTNVGSGGSPHSFVFVLAGDGGVFTSMELSFLATPGHSWNGVLDVQGH